MKRRLATLSLMLAGCAAVQGSPTFEVHDVLFYGDSNDRVTWFYDTQMDRQTKPLKINGLGYELKQQTATDSFALAGTLAINGQSSLLTKTTTIPKDFTVTYNPASSNYYIKTSRALEGVYLLQNNNWYRISSSVRAGFSGEADADWRSNGLQGVGQLTDAEAVALSNVLAKDQPVVVAVLADSPDPRLNVEPAPAQYRTTALFVQKGIPQEIRRTGGPVTFSQVRYAGNSGYGSSNFGAALITSESTYQSIWSKTNSIILPTPSAPDIDFNASSAVFLFLGQRPTGGYGFKVNSMEARGSTLIVRVTVSEPKPGAILTQAFTSPWGLYTVAGKYTSLQVIDQNGNTLVQTSSNRSPL
ncbi:protease complex subunit PrcB family protein [Deinococcus cellulosilyticus]|nr:protease complex subunit PrcB family protein [Deinococcus cellulosilyticus]